jgi:GT2 family glycosyltransferase
MAANSVDDRYFVSVIIPHFNGIQHLPDCLGSLQRQSYQNHEVILVDNGSTDGSQEFTRSHYPLVRLLQLSENAGFTGACIAGYEVSKGELVVLLNNDTEVDENWLAELVDTFERIPEAASVASKMLLFDERDRFHTAGDYYRVDGIPGNRGVWQRDIGQYDEEEAVFGACGGAAAYRKSVLKDTGFLDDDFYFSCEDVDLAWRLHLAGHQVIYAPGAVVYHKLKASAGTGADSSYFDGRNFLYILWKNYPSSLLRKHWRSIIKAQLIISGEALRNWRGQAARARLRGQLAGLWGYFKMRQKRQQIQSDRRIDDQTLEALLTPVDGTLSHR